MSVARPSPLALSLRELNSIEARGAKIVWPMGVKALHLVPVSQPPGRVGAHLPTLPWGRVWCLSPLSWGGVGLWIARAALRAPALTAVAGKRDAAFKGDGSPPLGAPLDSPGERGGVFIRSSSIAALSPPLQSGDRGPAPWRPGR